MKPRPGRKLFAVLFFYLLIVLIVVVFSPLLSIFAYPIIILASVLFILALGLKVPVGGFLVGAGAAAIAMGAILASLVLLGAIDLGPVRDDYVFLLIGGVFVQLLAVLGEELAFRASIFQGLCDELGIWPAALLSAASFALLHVPSMEQIGIGTQSGLVALGTIFLAGIALALLYAYGGLLNAMAFHATWNYIEYDLFNAGPLDGAIGVSKPGPVLLTGGPFGPEASIIALAVAAFLVVAVWLYYGRLHKTPEGSQTLSA